MPRDSFDIPNIPLAIRHKKQGPPYVEISQEIYDHEINNNDGGKYDVHETSEQKSLS